MKSFVIALIVTGIVIVGIVMSLEPFKINSNEVVRLSITAQTSPNDVKIHTQQQLADIDSGVTILDDSALSRICRAVFSQYCRSDAMPAPSPNVLVGVLTLTKMMSDSLMPFSIFVLKNRLRLRAAATTLARPGS